MHKYAFFHSLVLVHTKAQKRSIIIAIKKVLDGSILLHSAVGFFDDVIIRTFFEICHAAIFGCPGESAGML